MAVREGVCQRVHSMSGLRFPPQRLLACPSEAKVPRTARVTLITWWTPDAQAKHAPWCSRRELLQSDP
jgi:hypothetical protein